MKNYSYILIVCFCLMTILVHAQDKAPFTQFIGEDCHLGLLDIKQNELLPAKYAEITCTAVGNDWLITALTQSRYVYFLYKMNQLIPLQYPELERLNDRLLKVGQYGTYGLVNTDGQGILIMNYDGILPAGPSAAITIRQGRYGVVNLEGKRLIPEAYKNIQYWEMGGFWVEQGQQWQLMNQEGKKVEEAYYNEILSPRSGLPVCAVRSNEKWGVIAPDNKIIVPLENFSIQLFECGIIAVQEDSRKWYLHDLNGKRLLKESFEAVSSFEESGVIVYRKGKKGLLDKDGNVLLPIEFENIEVLGNAWAAIQNEEGYRIFDTKAQQFLAYEFESLQSGLNWTGVLFQQNEKWGWLDYSKNIRVQPTYTNATPQGHHSILVQDENRKLGALNIQGELVLPLEYTIITPKNKFFKVQKEGKNGWFYVNEQNGQMNCQLYR